MFSYRHAFHAGNHADVLKHAILVAILRHLALKDKAFWVFDTHAGAGRYRLDAAASSKNGEHEGGVMALWTEKRLPALLADYRDEVARFDRVWRKHPGAEAGRAGPARRADVPQDDLPAVPGWTADAPLPRAYPGSPWLALQQMRPQDRLRCFEAHPTEVRVLQQALAPAGRQVQIFGEDGFEGLKALLPPVSRRGLVVIDPSYEDKRDYARARRTLIEALERFATGTMLLWYPLVRRREAMLLMEHLGRLPGARDWLDVRLQVCRPPDDGYGLYGSGVYVINPPYTLAPALNEAMPVLHQLLGLDETAGWWMQALDEGTPPARAAEGGGGVGRARTPGRPHGPGRPGTSPGAGRAARTMPAFSPARAPRGPRRQG